MSPSMTSMTIKMDKGCKTIKEKIIEDSDHPPEYMRFVCPT